MGELENEREEATTQRVLGKYAIIINWQQRHVWKIIFINWQHHVWRRTFFCISFSTCVQNYSLGVILDDSQADSE